MSLSVLWSTDGGKPRPGRLDLAGGRLTLAGGSRDEPERHEVELAAVRDVRMGRRLSERVGGRPALVLELRDGSVLSIASFAAAGTLRELAERLWLLTAPALPPEPEAA